MPQRLRVFISSPGDVPDERLRAALVIDKLAQDFSPYFAIESYRWEHEPMLASGHFQDAIEPPSAFDIVLLILWSRLGTPLPESTPVREYRGIDRRAPVTRTEWEYEEALQVARDHDAPDLLAFRNVSPAPIDPRDSDAQARSFSQLGALNEFWRRHFADRGVFRAAYDEYRSLEEFAARLEQSLRKLIERRIKALRAGSGAQAAPVWLDAPFRGLASYELKHAAIFFGRDALVAKAAEQLAGHARSGAAFLLVSGASGSGKSSLVKAALVPRLMKPQRIEGAAFLRRALFRPSDGGHDIILALVQSLARGSARDGVGLPELLAPGQTAAELCVHLRATAAAPGFVFAGALGRLTEEGRGSGRLLAFEQAKLILVVDQLEELFTLAAVSPDDRSLFIRLLGGLARSGAVWVVATLRADFWHRAAEISELIDLAQGQGRLDVPAPSPAELAEMIRKPAEAAGLAFEVHGTTGLGLDAVLAEHAASAPGVLPLLSFTLDALYAEDVKRRGGQLLTHATYEALGGLEGAIATRADEIVAGLPGAAQAAVPRVLRALATVAADAGHTAVARACPIETFAGGSDARVVVDAFTSARLLVASDEGTIPTVRLAHEALINSWKRARDQLVADRRDLETRALVERQQARWRHHGGGLSKRQLLLRDPDLANALDLARRWGDEVDDGTRAFIETSRRRARLRQQLIGAAAAVFALMACGAAVAAWFAVQNEQRASQSLELAVDQADALVSKISSELKDSSGVSKDAIRRILVVIEQGFDEIAKVDAENPRLLLSRATMLSAFVDNYIDLGDLAEARCRAQACVDIMRPLVRDTSGDIDMIRGLGSCIEQLASALHEASDLAAAAAAYRESIALRRRALGLNPGNATARFELGHVLCDYGNALLTMGKPDEALTAVREGLAISTGLAASDPSNAKWQREYVEGLNYQSLILDFKGQAGEALAGYEKARDTTQGLSDGDRGNASLQRDLSNILASMGLLLAKLDRNQEAEASFQRSLDLRRALVALDPGNTTWQYEYAVALFYVGYQQSKIDKPDDALVSFRTMRDTLQALLAHDPDNALWRSQLVYGLWWIAVVSTTRGDAEAALSAARAAADDLQKLDIGKLDPTTQKLMQELQAGLSKLLASGQQK